MIVKTPGSQMGTPAVAEGGGEARGGGRGKPEWREKCKRGRRWSRRRQKRDQGQEKLCPWMKRRGFRREFHRNCRRRHRRHCHQSSERSRRYRHARLQRRHSSVHQHPRCQRQSQKRDDEPRDSERRCDTMLDFASARTYHAPRRRSRRRVSKTRNDACGHGTEKSEGLQPRQN